MEQGPIFVDRPKFATAIMLGVTHLRLVDRCCALWGISSPPFTHQHNYRHKSESKSDCLLTWLTTEPGARTIQRYLNDAQTERCRRQYGVKMSQAILSRSNSPSFQGQGSAQSLWRSSRERPQSLSPEPLRQPGHAPAMAKGRATELRRATPNSPNLQEPPMNALRV